MTEQEIYNELDILKAQMSEIKQKMKDLVASLPNTYVIQRTWIKEYRWNGGSMSEGHIQYCSRCGSQDHTFISTKKDFEGNHTFKSLRDAESLLQFLLDETKNDFTTKYLHYEIVPL